MPHKPAKVPAFIAPRLPVLSAEPPKGAGWIHEIKHNVLRTLISIAGKDARAFTRSGLDWSDKYHRVISACRKLRCRSTLTDGEIIVQDSNGVSDFAALRSAIDQALHRLLMFACNRELVIFSPEISFGREQTDHPHVAGLWPANC